ncbi:YcxB family protein [Streptomyces sp. NBC_00328]|uniref:YcxB family protein n=1 Tax=Streptomyces sp. NBC_00328 TaxID=2903646 RepID=UPI002E2C70E9|nr:YcxB family protein [Streptomyces sp. NBC_00328]
MVEDQGAALQQKSPEEPRGAGADVVELEYTPVVADFTSALRARKGASKAGRRQYWVIGGVAVAAAVQVAEVVSGHGGSPFLGVWLAVFVPLILLSPWLMARQFLRLAERQGTFRVSVTDAGLTVATDNSTTVLNWVAQPRYRETKDVFVMLSPDKNAVGFTMLPKRAVRTPEDVDRLRAILDRNLTRV